VDDGVAHLDRPFQPAVRAATAGGVYDSARARPDGPHRLLGLVCQSGQACAAPPDTPIIALTQHPDQVHRVRLLQRGSDDVIVKPFSYPERPEPNTRAQPR
jgi:CheY-like chemotaxis protein